MENSIGNRISELIRSLRLSTNAFAKSINKSQSAISLIIEGRSKPSFEVLDAICEKYSNVNPTWLLVGDGEMLAATKIVPSVPDQYLKDHVKQLEESFKRLAQQLEVKDKQIENKDQQIEGLQKTVNVLLGKSEDVIHSLTSPIMLALYPEMGEMKVLSLYPGLDRIKVRSLYPKLDKIRA